MHLHADAKTPESLNHGKALALFELVTRLRRVWVNFEPEPPLKRSEMSLLGVIVHQGRNGEEDITVGSLAKAMRQSVPGISQKVGKLEKYGYITKITDTNDRRTAKLELTPKGRQAAQNAFNKFITNTEKALAVIGEEKTDSLLEQMKDFCDALEEKQNPNGI